MDLARFARFIPSRRTIEIVTWTMVTIVALLLGQQWYRSIKAIAYGQPDTTPHTEVASLKAQQRAKLEAGPLTIERAMDTFARANRMDVALVRPESSTDPAPAAGWMHHPSYRPPPAAGGPDTEPAQETEPPPQLAPGIEPQEPGVEPVQPPEPAQPEAAQPTTPEQAAPEAQRGNAPVAPTTTPTKAPTKLRRRAPANNPPPPAGRAPTGATRW